jgi:hypothetical protein
VPPTPSEDVIFDQCRAMILVLAFHHSTNGSSPDEYDPLEHATENTKRELDGRFRVSDYQLDYGYRMYQHIAKDDHEDITSLGIRRVWVDLLAHAPTVRKSRLYGPRDCWSHISGGPPQDEGPSQCDVYLRFIGTLTTKCVDIVLPPSARVSKKRKYRF